MAIGSRIAVAAAILGVAIVRWRLAGVALERDEGEYAYAGQLILGGTPPYTLAYNMKFPGAYYAYAAIMAVLGQTPWAIHIGLLLVNGASIVLVYAIGRRLAGDFSGAVAAASFALLSLSQSILGVFAHATHFALLPALGGFLLLLAPRFALHDGGGGDGPARRTTRALISGALLGVSVLMKQHAIFLLAWGAVMIAWRAFDRSDLSSAEPHDRTARRSGVGKGETARVPSLHELGSVGDLEENSRPGASRPTTDRSSGARKDHDRTAPTGREPRSIRVRAAGDLAAFAGGALLPLIGLCLLFLVQGVLGRFWFWTFGYAREYVTEIPLSAAASTFTRTLTELTRSNGPLWVLAFVGLGVLWIGGRSRQERLFVTGLLTASFLSVCPGFYFRQHYFVLMLPALALLIALPFDALRRALETRGHGLGGAGISAAIFLAVAAVCVYPQIDYLWSMDLRDVSRTTYGGNPFPESVEIARYISEHAAAEDRIAVLGSEPQIYFYAKRLSATGYIYTYPLMEPQRYAASMQAEMIKEIESAHPKFLVLVKTPTSWLIRPDSVRTILDWSDRYVSRCYDLVGVVDIVSMTETRYAWDDQAARYKPASGNLIAVFKSKSAQPCDGGATTSGSGHGGGGANANGSARGSGQVGGGAAASGSTPGGGREGDELRAHERPRSQVITRDRASAVMSVLAKAVPPELAKTDSHERAQ